MIQPVGDGLHTLAEMAAAAYNPRMKETSIEPGCYTLSDAARYTGLSLKDITTAFRLNSEMPTYRSPNCAARTSISVLWKMVKKR